MSNPIHAFLEERKQAKLKKPGNKTPEEIESQFQLSNWVADAAKRSGQLSMVSHPGKFSHPDARISPLLSSPTNDQDGLLRSGNVDVPEDVLGNAAALDVYAFLTLTLSDGRTLLRHLESDSDEVRSLLNTDEKNYAEWKEGLLAIKKPDARPRSDGNVKQVYFPVSEPSADDGYHLLSVLTPSGLIAENKRRLSQMKFSDEAKQAREARRKEQPSSTGFSDMLGILRVKYGGTQPQNISKLNSVNAGEAWLLSSLPPEFAPGHVRFPRRDFFKEQSWDKQLKTFFDRMHRIFSTNYNNVDIRDARRWWCHCLYDWVFENAALLQSQPGGWSEQDSVRIPREQAIWLDEGQATLRDTDDEWRTRIAEQMADWCLVTYRRMRKRYADSVTLGQIEETEFRIEIEKYARHLEASVL